MKHCPVCNSTYTDDTLRFCLQDGAALSPSGVSTASGPSSGPDSAATLHSGSMPTLNLSAGPDHQSEPTLVLPAGSAHQSEPTMVVAPAVDTVRQHRRPTLPTNERKPRNLALVVVLTMMATLIVVAFAAGGYWLLWGRESANFGGGSDEINTNGGERTAKVTPTPTGSHSPNANAAPSITPTPDKVDDAVVEDEITTILNGWVSAARARDAAANLAYYADTLNPYYNSANFPVSKVREERARVYAIYQTMDIELTNIKIAPDPSGDRATATFDKTWTFENPSKFTSGSVRSQMWFAKSGGRWLITGEKDVKVYYLNR